MAEFRAVNGEYGTHEVEKQRYTSDLKVLGGAFEIDRIIAGMGGIADEVALQSSQKVKAASALFSDTIINGNSSTDANVFDGLDVAVTGSDTEYTGNVDLSTSAKVTENATAFLDAIDEWMLSMDGVDCLMMNTKALAKMRAVARRQGMYQSKLNDFGQQVEYYGNIPMIDLGAKPGSNAPIVGIDGEGNTSIYAVRFGMDGFHAVSMAGQAPVKIWLPDFSTAGAVKKGEVEMVAGCALKSTKAAGVFRGVKVQ
jgi:hypothetical protein